MKTQEKNGATAKVVGTPGVDRRITVKFKKTGRNPHPESRKVMNYIAFVVENWDKVLTDRHFVFWEGTPEYEVLQSVENNQDVLIRYDDENKRYPFSNIRLVE